ncbi:MAG: tRNA 2-thiocytidine(32) synthetase TtcA, partial [Saccharospirillum sp.]
MTLTSTHSTSAADIDTDQAPDSPAVTAEKKAKTEFNKVQKRLRRETGRAIADFNM